MCIVIDINSFSKVFDSDDAEHANFSPVLRWVMDGGGKVVYGGKGYKKELAKLSRFTSLLATLSRFNKVVELPSGPIDEHTARVKAQYPNKDFDDPHIVAIFCAADVRLLCTHEHRLIPYLKDRNLYPAGRKPPAVYRSSRNKTLLSDSNIGTCCGAKVRLNKVARQGLVVKAKRPKSAPRKAKR